MFVTSNFPAPGKSADLQNAGAPSRSETRARDSVRSSAAAQATPAMGLSRRLESAISLSSEQVTEAAQNVRHSIHSGFDGAIFAHSRLDPKTVLALLE